MNGVFEPADETTTAAEEILELAAGEAAPADHLRQRRYGPAGEELNEQQQHRHASYGRQPGNARRNDVRDIERQDGKGIGPTLQAGQEFIERQGGVARAGEHPIERLVES